MAYTDKIVMSIGGSLVVPNGGINSDFLKKLNEFIRDELAKNPNRQFFLVIGGGTTSRHYRDAGREVIGHELSRDDLDWLGIYSTRFHAEFLKLILGKEFVEEKIILDPTLPINFTKKIILGGGWKPGNSTDLCAVSVAKVLGAKKVINLSNTDYVYDSDPKINPNAKKIEKISWADYRKLIPSEWNPGLNSPFDPVASKMAEEAGIEVIIMNGKPIDNLTKCLNGEEFQGTIIS